MTNQPDPLLYDLQQMTIDLSLIERKHLVPGTLRHENDIEHSFTVALLCWYIHDRYSIDLDISKILKYAMAHDFVERYAGDVSTFASTSEREAKIIQERASLDRLSTEYEQFDDLITTMEAYEAKDDEESLFVWSVDKMQQLIMGELDDWRSYAEGGITYEQFAPKYDELADKSSPYCREIFDGLVAYSKSTYYEQPSALLLTSTGGRTLGNHSNRL